MDETKMNTTLLDLIIIVVAVGIAGCFFLNTATILKVLGIISNLPLGHLYRLLGGL